MRAGKLRKQATILIAGPRSVTSYGVVKVYMDSLFDIVGCDAEDITNITIIEGGAKGVDASAKRYAEDKGFRHKQYPALWGDMTAEPCKVGTKKGKKYNKLAGFNRNKSMVDDADVGVIFWDGESKGTAHTDSLCAKKQSEYEDSQLNCLDSGEPKKKFLHIPVPVLTPDVYKTVLAELKSQLKEGEILPGLNKLWFDELTSVKKAQVWDGLTKSERAKMKGLIRKIES